MEYVKLESGWLENQIRKTQEQVAQWPEWMREHSTELASSRQSNESTSSEQTSTPASDSGN